MDDAWTLSELVSEVAARIAALPAPSNGQVRAVPDERTVRYYGTIGLLDRPVAMRGRTALYNRRHLAQVVAIKRLQTMGRSLAEIQALWPTLDDHTLSRMSGIGLAATARAERSGQEPGPLGFVTRGRKDFWKREPAPQPPPVQPMPMPPPPASGLPPAVVVPQAGGGARGRRAVDEAASDGARAVVAVELRVELAPNVSLVIGSPDDLTLSSADVRAIRAAAAPLVAELARCRLAKNDGGEEP